MYSWMRLMWTSNSGVGVEDDPEPLLDHLPQRDLVVAADRGEALLERGVVGVGGEVGEPGRVVEERRADRVGDVPGQRRVCLEQPAAERDAVGLVDNAVGVDPVEVAEDRLLHEVGVQRRHAVDASRPEEGEVAHPHVAGLVLLDQRDVGEQCLVGVAGRALRVEVQRVDEVDDLHVARQQSLHQRDRPALERLGQQRVVGVVEHRRRDRPGLRPGDAVVVDQEPHELGDGDRRVRVVELDRDVVGQRDEVAVLLLVPAQQVLQRRRGEEDLLPQAQLVPGRRGVGGIEHARHGFQRERGRRARRRDRRD